MRIMHISTRLILGGSQENTVLSCEGQARRGHVVSLVFGPIYGPEGSLLERVEKFRTAGPGEIESISTDQAATHPLAPSLLGRGDKGVETIETPNLVRELSLTNDPKCYRDLKAIIRRWRPDVVHTHSSKAGILGRMAAWDENVPCVIHTVHGPAFHPYEKKWRNGLYIAAEKYAAKKCHRIVCVAEAMRDQFLAKNIGRPEQYAIVYSGMEVENYLNPPPAWSRRIVRQSLNLNEGDFVIGTIARLAKLKGHDDLLDALADDMKRDRAIKLLWVGDGWWADRLRKRIDDLDLHDQVVLTGLVPPEEIPRYLQAMDVLAHPSYREGLPRTVVQALLSGIATAAYDVDGTREVCITGRTGRLIAAGDRAALREALLWLRNHPAERKAMGESGRELCRHRFDADVMVEHLDAIYAEVLGNKWIPPQRA